MGQAKCRVSGFIANVKTGQTKTGKTFFEISLATGKSEKLPGGGYDNSKQAWWRLTAFGDYADLLRHEDFKKGDNIVALVNDPQPSVFFTHDGKPACNIQAVLWNHTLCRVMWLPKDARAADNYTPNMDDAPAPMDMNDADLASLEAAGAGQTEIPF